MGKPTKGERLLAARELLESASVHLYLVVSSPRPASDEVRVQALNMLSDAALAFGREKGPRW